LNVRISEVEPIHPMVDKVLIAFKVIVGDHRNFCFELLEKMLVIIVFHLFQNWIDFQVLPFLNLLLRFLLRFLSQQISILREIG
jgi:hypothetical protein